MRHHGTIAKSCTVEGGVGDVGDVHLRGDGGMERGHAPIPPPPGAGKLAREGQKEWSAGAPAARSCRHTMFQWGGGGIHKVSGGVHLDVGVLRLPHRVSAHRIEGLVKGGRLRGEMQNFKGGELAAEFLPQSCGPGLRPKIGVAGGAV